MIEISAELYEEWYKSSVDLSKRNVSEPLTDSLICCIALVHAVKLSNATEPVAAIEVATTEDQPARFSIASRNSSMLARTITVSGRSDSHHINFDCPNSSPQEFARECHMRPAKDNQNPVFGISGHKILTRKGGNELPWSPDDEVSISGHVEVINREMDRKKALAEDFRIVLKDGE